MKRFIPIIVLFLIVAGGYMYLQQKKTLSVSESAVGEQDHIKEVKEIGLISSLGNISVPGSGTHLLTRTDKTTVLLTGLGANLDEYLDKNVEVDGRLTQTQSGKELIQVLSIRLSEVTPSPTDSADNVTTWEDFKDVGLGISLRRRHNWKLSQGKDFISFAISIPSLSCSGDTCPPDDHIRIEKKSNIQGASLASFTGNEKLATKNIVGLHSLVGYKATDPISHVVTLAVAKDTSVFILTCTPGSEKTVDALTNDFFSLIHSFDFFSTETKPITIKK